MRADRLLRLALLLQSRGRMTASALADELEVSVRTVYRDIEALGTAGVPVIAESGPGGGCELIAGYRMPLTSLSTEEATALLALGVPAPIRELGLAPALQSAHDRVRAASGAPQSLSPCTSTSHGGLDQPSGYPTCRYSLKRFAAAAESTSPTTTNSTEGSESSVS